MNITKDELNSFYGKRSEETRNGYPLRRALFNFAHTQNFSGRFSAPVWVAERKEFAVPVNAERFRFRIRNRNFLSSADSTGLQPVTQYSLYVGEHLFNPAATGSFTAPPVKVVDNLTIQNTKELVTDWINPDVYKLEANKRLLISSQFYALAGTDISYHAATSWVNYGPAADQTASTGYAFANGNGFLDVTIEYETFTPNPFILVVSNSLSSVGIDAARGELSVWDKKLSLATGCPVSSIAVPGGWQAHYADLNNAKWGALPVTYQPDYIILFALQSSDITAATPLQTVKDNTALMIGQIKLRYPKAKLVTTTIPPRVESSGDPEAQRLAWNTYISTLPYGYDSLVDVDRLFNTGTNPDRLKSVFTTDNTHFNDRAHSVTAGAVEAVIER